MSNDSALHKAYRQLHLWPPIHAAVDVFLKRKAAQAEPYELTWRLIHVWECIVITLCEACTTRLIGLKDRASDVRIIREKCYGRAWNEAECSLERRVGAFDGSIDRWIEILEYISTIEVKDGESAFLAAVVKFLNSGISEGEEATLINVAPLISAWGRACDVPAGIKAERVSVKSALKAINTFRNRFAHVPFPYDAIEEVFRTLETSTEELFSARPAAATPQGALSGVIAYQQTLIKGSIMIPNPLPSPSDQICFVYGLTKTTAEEIWPAARFIHIDKMFRPYVLSRLKDEAGLWEYTRYLAESNAVITVRSPELFEAFAIPSEKEYAPPETIPAEEPVRLPPEPGTCAEESTTTTTTTTPAPQAVLICPAQVPPVTSMPSAVAAIRDRHFDLAIEYLERVVADRPNYHVGWLNLGRAQREWAVDLREVQNGEPNRDRSLSLLERSLESFERAKGHIDRQYRAEAGYHASKSHYRLWKHDGDPERLRRAIQEAEAAKNTFPDAKYETWLEYLNSAGKDPASGMTWQPVYDEHGPRRQSVAVQMAQLLNQASQAEDAALVAVLNAQRQRSQVAAIGIPDDGGGPVTPADQPRD